MWNAGPLGCDAVMLTAREVISGLGPLLKRPLQPDAEGLHFARVVVDSRAVGRGDLFVALRGEHTDGHQFIPDALQRGARGVIFRDAATREGLPEASQGEAPAFFKVEDPLSALQRLATFRRSTVPVRAIGVTGSVGKTTTKEAVAGLLAQYFPILKSQGNLNTEIGIPLVLLELEHQHRYLVAEMGMNALGEIAELCRLVQPAIGVVTNVGPVHLARLGSIEAIADAKAELVESLPEQGLAVLNKDDPRVTAMARRTRASTVAYGLGVPPMPGGPSSDEPPLCYATHVQACALDGVTFLLHWNGRSQPVHTPLLGRHCVYACLAAAAVGLWEGLTLDQVATGLSSLKAESRVKVRTARSGATVLDDSYNASPASVKAALDLLGDMPGRRVAILGDMLELGEEEARAHQEVGGYAARCADLLVAIGPRMALAVDAARQGGLSAVTYYAEKSEAQRHVEPLTGPEDYILIKASRGMALEELVDALCEGEQGPQPAADVVGGPGG